jgi:exopolysaccharide biosynthesis polyprenyl glycosylphosphotransferase
VSQGEFSFPVRDGVPPARRHERHVPATGEASRRRSPWWRDALLRRMLAVADVSAGLVVALYLALGPPSTPHAYAVALAGPAWILLAKLYGLYDRDQRALRVLTVDELPRICLWGLTVTAGATALLSTLNPAAVALSSIAATWLVACTSALILRLVGRSLWRVLTPPERAMIVGDGALAAAVRRKFLLFPDIHLQLVANPTLEDRESLSRMLQDAYVERVILASESIDEALIAELLSTCRRERVKLSIVPPVRSMFGTAVQLDNVADLPFLQYNTWDVSRSTLLLKRALDVCLSLVAIVVLLPAGLLIGLAIRLDTPGPIIFLQWRAGRRGRPFRMLKFRTMTKDAEAELEQLVPFDELDEPVFKLRNDPRVTRVGRLLRRTSLDELPQLINVFRGDMSLVGPRPEQVELVERYAPEERTRLLVKPGLTGPMQVSGRGDLTLEERIAVEREYIENLALGRDLEILAMTIPAVLGARGAY